MGFLDKLFFIEQPADAQDLNPDEIEISVDTTVLNFRDLLIALGHISASYFGAECAGTVSRVSGSLQHSLKIGDRVVAVSENAFSKSCRCKAFQATKIPEDMDSAEAVSCAVAYCTAYYSLVHWARATQGEWVLIHSGSGGFGQAAIQLAQYLGCSVITTVGSEEKVELLNNAYGIPKSHIFSSRSCEFERGIKRLTGGRGVDIVLNSLTGEALRSSWECVAPFGRFIELGKKDILRPQSSSFGGLPMRPLEKNIIFASVDLMQVSRTEQMS